MQLAIQGPRVLPLLLVHRKPILPKDDVVPHCQGEQRGSTRRYFPPAHPTSFIQTHNRTRLLCYRARLARTSHTELSTNSTLPTVKWKTPFARRAYLVDTAFVKARLPPINHRSRLHIQDQIHTPPIE